MIKFIFLYILLSLNSFAKVNSTQMTYGLSIENRKLSANIFYDDSVKQKSMILITEGIHGNEYLGLVENITNTLKKDLNENKIHQYLSQGGVLITIPKINPDGVSRRTRFSSSGSDLNRQFHIDESSEHIETQALKEFLAKFINHHKLDLLFAMDYHCCAQALVRPKSDQVHSEVYQYLTQSSYDSFGKAYMVDSSDKIFGSSFHGTLKDYLNKKYQTPTITYEAPNLAEAKNINKHIDFWSSISGYFSKKRTPTQHVAVELSKSTFFNGFKTFSQKHYSE